MKRRDLLALSLAAVSTLLPLPGNAQHYKIPVIGFLYSTSPGTAAPLVAVFRQGLNETGYVEGRNVAIEYLWAEGRYDQLPALAADLVARKVDLIATGGGTPAALAAKNATSTIPVVSFTGGDPVDFGLVASLARPGGNITGVTVIAGELLPKRLELLIELIPKAKVIALLVNPTMPRIERVLREMQEVAHAKGLQLAVAEAATDSEVDAAFATLVQLHADALVVGADPFFSARDTQLVALASDHALPAIYERREFASLGGLVSYGTSYAAGFHQIGVYAGRILKGTKPAELPVMQPTRFRLAINLKTANALGLTVRPSLLASADEVIE